MAKQSGLGDNCYVAGYDLSNDLGGLSNIGGGPVALQTPGLDKHAMERIGGKRDGRIEYNAFFNPAADKAHDRLSLLPTTDTIVTYCRGTTLGNPSASVVAKQINYDGNRGNDGEFTLDGQTLGNGYGLEWGRLLTAGKRTDTEATNGTAVDLAAASPGAFGLSAYLQIFAFAGTDVTVKIQESSDNGADAYADVVGGGFTQITSTTPAAQRIATAAINVERYLRVVTVTTGGFTSLVFAVQATRHSTAVSF